MFNKIINKIFKLKEDKEYPEDKLMKKLLNKDLKWTHADLGYMYQTTWDSTKDDGTYFCLRIDKEISFCSNNHKNRKSYIQISLEQYNKEQEPDVTKSLNLKLIDCHSPLALKLFEKANKYMHDNRNKKIKSFLDDVCDNT